MKNNLFIIFLSLIIFNFSFALSTSKTNSKNKKTNLELNFNKQTNGEIRNYSELDNFAETSEFELQNSKKGIVVSSNSNNNSNYPSSKSLSQSVSKVDATLSSTPSFKAVINLESATESMKPKESTQKKTVETSYLLMPSYKFNDNYSLGAALSGDIDNTSKSGKLSSLALSLNFYKFDIGSLFKVTSVFRNTLPVSEKQKLDGFLFGSGLRLIINSTENTFGSDRFSFQGIISVHKSFYEYTTAYVAPPSENESNNLTATSVDVDEIDIDALDSVDSTELKYNPQTSISERLSLTIKLVSKLSLNLIYGDTQSWDYGNNTKNIYEFTELLNVDFTDSFSFYTGITNSDSLYGSNNEFNLKVVDNTNFGNSKFLLGLTYSF